MNWSKTLTVLIIVFLILNIGLWRIYEFENQKQYTLSQENEQRIKKILLDNNIIMYELLPNYFPMQKLSVEYISVDQEKVVKSIFGKIIPVSINNESSKSYQMGTEKIIFKMQEEKGKILYENPKGRAKVEDFNNKSLIEKNAKSFAEDLTLGASDLKLIRYLEIKENYYVLEFCETYQDNILFTSYVKIKYTIDGITEAEAFRYRPIGMIGNKRNIYPPDEVLYNFMQVIRQESENEPIFIKGIDIGYNIGLESQGDEITATAIPYYRILLDTGEIYYINAYKNEVKPEISTF